MDCVEAGAEAAQRDLGRLLINRQPNADLDAPPNVRYWGSERVLAGTAGLVPDLVCASQVGVQRCHHLGALADRGGR